MHTTALHEAAARNHLEVAKLLLSSDVIRSDMANTLGLTPLHLAVQHVMCQNYLNPKP